MNQKDALLLLEELNQSNGRLLDEHQIIYILARIQWKLPFFIQLFFKTYSLNRDDYQSMPIEEATELIFKEMANEHQLYTWSERLSGYGKDEKIGGTPLIANLMAKHLQNSPSSAEAKMKDMLAEMAPYFRGKLAQLPPMQRKIVIELLKSPTPLSLKQLREATGLKSSDLTSQISRLNALNILYIDRQEPKKSLYGIVDKIFKTWYMLNHSVATFGSNTPA